jgi:hypothetical protein
MTTSGAPGTGERYPGETLDLLRAIAGEVGELRKMRQEFAPLIEAARTGGLLGMARAARRARNGATSDDYPDEPGDPGPGPGPAPALAPGIWQRTLGRHAATGPGPGAG